MKCYEAGCVKDSVVRGLCRHHYDKARAAQRREKQAELAPTWTPPTELSGAHVATMRRRAEPRTYQERPCALTACGGIAAHGSDLCPAHDYYRAAQKRLAARGLA